MRASRSDRDASSVEQDIRVVLEWKRSGRSYLAVLSEIKDLLPGAYVQM